ncbi:NADP-dependent oxidoreductase domain-containing protein [Bisporella sp. PMI_857]|nr:NADP-dependent oxidoreductase domain-containing protein [Bisporella sp. PMI_857]
MEIQSLLLRDGNSIPMIGFGTGTAWYKPEGKGPFDQSLVNILKKAINAGFYHIDCADAYGTEEELGVAIRESGVPREELFITTKVQDNVLNISQAIDESLKKLQLSYVDLYLIHTPYFARRMKISKKRKWHQIAAFKGLAPLTKGKGGPIDPLLEILAKYGVEPSAILLDWHNQQNIIAITTTRNPARLAQYQKAVMFKLTPSEMEEITQVGVSHHFRAAQQKKFDINDRT